MCDNARFNAQRADVNQHDNREIDDKISQGIHERRDFAGEFLHGRERRIVPVELADFVFLVRKCADDARSGKVLARDAKHPVKTGLHLSVERDSGEHDAEYDDAQHGNRDGKDERGLPIDGKRHNHRTEYDDGRTGKEPQRQIHAGLHLRDIACHARDHGRGAHPVDVGEGELLRVSKERRADIFREADRGLGRKILREHRAGEADKSEQHEKSAHAENIGLVACRNADVDDVFHDERNHQLENRFQHLEKGCGYRGGGISFHIFQKLCQIHFLRKL